MLQFQSVVWLVKVLRHYLTIHPSPYSHLNDSSGPDLAHPWVCQLYYVVYYIFEYSVMHATMVLWNRYRVLKFVFRAFRTRSEHFLKNFSDYLLLRNATVEMLSRFVQLTESLINPPLSMYYLHFLMTHCTKQSRSALAPKHSSSEFSVLTKILSRLDFVSLMIVWTAKLYAICRSCYDCSGYS